MTRIQFLILLGSCFLEICPELNLNAKTRKVCHGATKRMKTTNMTKIANYRLEGGWHESAQGPRLKNTKIDKIMKGTNLTNLNYKNLDGDQNERACANRCDKQ